MGGNEPVSRSEFETYTRLTEKLRDADRTQVARLASDIDDLDERLDAELKTLTQQREDDQRTAAESSQRRREWSWQKVSAVIMAALALAALWVQSLALHK